MKTREIQSVESKKDFSIIGKIRNKKWNTAIHKQVLKKKSDKIKKLAEKVMKTDSEEHNIWKAIRDLTGTHAKFLNVLPNS